MLEHDYQRNKLSLPPQRTRVLLPKRHVASVPRSMVSIIQVFHLHGFSHLIRDEYVAVIPEAERGDMILAYHAQLSSADDEVRLRAARAWSKWE